MQRWVPTKCHWKLHDRPPGSLKNRHDIQSCRWPPPHRLPFQRCALNAVSGGNSCAGWRSGQSADCPRYFITVAPKLIQIVRIDRCTSTIAPPLPKSLNRAVCPVTTRDTASWLDLVAYNFWLQARTVQKRERKGEKSRTVWVRLDYLMFREISTRAGFLIRSAACKCGSKALLCHTD